MHDEFWTGRVTGELAVIAFLTGKTADAVRLNHSAFEIAQQQGDQQGQVRQKSLEGVGLLEQHRLDEALIRFDDALDLARSTPGIRFPLMAYMGKSQTLEALGDERQSDDLLNQALHYVDEANMQVYKADLLLELALRANKRKQVATAERLLKGAADASKRAGMPRPYAEANLHLAELYVSAKDYQRAALAIRECISASRQLVDMYFLPNHLALAAEIETGPGHIQEADRDYDDAENLVESMLLNVPSASVKASLIAKMDSVFRGHFELPWKRRTGSMMLFGFSSASADVSSRTTCGPVLLELQTRNGARLLRN